MKVKLDVGYNGDFSVLRRILEKQSVSSVYTGGIKGKIAGGRPQFIDSLESLAPQVSYAHSKGVLVNLALNAPGGIPDLKAAPWWEDIASYLKALESIGVDGVIVSHPFLMEMVKNQTQMKLVVSTVCEVGTARSARYYEDMGADVIVPSMNVNFDRQALEDIKGVLKHASLRIMVNEHCLPDCPYRYFHYIHTTRCGDDMDFFSRCMGTYSAKPHLMLTNNLIRPEDLSLYADIAGDFKLVSRHMMDVEDILALIDAYSAGKYEGNYVDLNPPLKFLNKTLFIDNTALDGLGEMKLNCRGQCHGCDRCLHYFNKSTVLLPVGK